MPNSNGKTAPSSARKTAAKKTAAKNAPAKRAPAKRAPAPGRAKLDVGVMKRALKAKDYDKVIAEVRAAMAADPVGALANKEIHDWIEVRFRNLFLQEATSDSEVLNRSRGSFPLNLLDRRSEARQVSDRMLKGFDPSELELELPPAQPVGFGNTTLLFAPGLLTGLLPDLAFQSIWPTLRQRFGLRILASDSHPMRGTEANVADLENAIERGIGVDTNLKGDLITAADKPKPPGDVLVIGYSKGGPDFLSLLVARPDLAPRIKGFIGWAGAIGGSPTGDDIYNQVKDSKAFDTVGGLSGNVAKAVFRLAPIAQINKIDRRTDEYDIKGAIESLTTWFRDDFNKKNASYFERAGVPMFYCSGATSVTEVPYFQKKDKLALNKLDHNNDMQLTQAATRPPMRATPHLAMFHADHWDLSYDRFPWYQTMGSRRLKHPFAREAAMATIIQSMGELGLLS